jgi:hypothetical protein
MFRAESVASQQDKVLIGYVVLREAGPRTISRSSKRGPIRQHMPPTSHRNTPLCSEIKFWHFLEADSMRAFIKYRNKGNGVRASAAGFAGAGEPRALTPLRATLRSD